MLEPETPFVEGWPLLALCEHLEAITDGKINRLLANVPPGFMKSLLVNVFWPAWEWGPKNKAHLRYVTFSYAAHLTERDNRRFLTLLESREYQEMWGDRFEIIKAGETLVSTSKMGWKLATSFGGVGTGERGDRVLLDDPHDVNKAESDAVRTKTVTWFRESMSNRLNNLRESVVIVIMQRVHEADVSGEIIKEKLPYVHLMIPMEFEAKRRCVTKIGWADPRTKEGELAWPDRFQPEELSAFRSRPYMWAGQYQQTPEPRGGAIIKREYWQSWDPPDNRFPPFEFVLASADTAYTEKEENDPTGFVVLGVWRDKNKHPKVMLCTAWRKRLEIIGMDTLPLPNENDRQWRLRTQERWGLTEWLAYSCRRFKVDRLIIEGKASGHSVAQTIKKLHFSQGWGVRTVSPEGDKVARAHAVLDIFADKMVYAPDREWVEMVIDEAAKFPKGTYRDLTDAMTQGLKYLRDTGLLLRREEVEAEEREAAMYKPPLTPIYDV